MQQKEASLAHLNWTLGLHEACRGPPLINILFPKFKALFYFLLLNRVFWGAPFTDATFHKPFHGRHQKFVF